MQGENRNTLFSNSQTQLKPEQELSKKIQALGDATQATMTTFKELQNYLESVMKDSMTAETAAPQPTSDNVINHTDRKNSY